MSHIGSDKSNFRDRIERHCKWGGSLFEAIDYGLKDTARDVVISLIVDDGVPKRIHRQNIMSKDHKHVAIAGGPHKEA